MAYIGKAPASGIRNRFIYTATAGQTTFSGSDDHNRTLSYVDEHFVDVYLNGVKLDKSDITATSGTSVVLDEGAAVDDILEVVVYDTFSIFSNEFDNDITVGGNLTADGDLTVDTDTLYVDSTNDRVAVGASSATYDLDVQGNTNGNVITRVKNSSAGTSARAGIFLENDEASVFTIQNSSSAYNGVSSWTNAGVISTASDHDNGLILNSQSGGVRFQTGTTERMRVDGANVLIGKTSVTNSGGGHVLRGSDSALFSRNASNVASETIQITRHASDGLLMRLNTGSSGNATMKAGIGVLNGDGMYFTTGTGATERMRLESTGKLIKYGNLTSARIQPQTNGTGYLGESSFRWTQLYVTTATNVSSDSRLKTDIQDSDLGYDFIKSLRPVSYRVTNSGSDYVTDDNGDVVLDENGKETFAPVAGTRMHYGFIAQEVKKSLGANAGNISIWGLDDPDDPNSFQSLAYEELISPLTKALQEAITKIEALETENATQATTIADFETRIAALEAN